jgi:hypothetical protein
MTHHHLSMVISPCDLIGQGLQGFQGIGVVLLADFMTGAAGPTMVSAA